MSPLSLRKSTSILLSALLITTLFVIANSSVSHASSTSPDEVDAVSGSNRFVVWSDKTPGNWEIFFRRSTDNGATWKPIVNLSNNPGSSRNPGIAVSGSNVYLVWSQSNADNTVWDINFRRSTDNGATWKPVVKVASNIGGTAPQVITSASNVYMIWGQNNGEIYITRSADNGVTWKPIFNLSSNVGASTAAQIAVSGTNVYVVWMQSAASGSSTDVLFRRSTDNGATWKPKVNLSISGLVHEPPELAVSGSNIHVVWIQSNQVSARGSTDSGATWKSVKIIASSTIEVYDRPRVAAAGSSVYVVYEMWVDAPEVSTTSCGGENVRLELQFATSADSGSTWKPSVELYEKGYGSCAAGNESIVSHILALGSNVYVAWREGGMAHGQAFFRASNDKGVTWQEILPLITSTGSGPGIDIAASSSSAYLVVWSWGEVYFYRSLDSGATIEPQKNLSNNTGRSTTAQIAI
jgi:BNR repeat protein